MTMRAVRVTKYGGPEVLKVEEVPIPKPKEKEVLVKVYSAGVNPVDTYVRAGDFAQRGFDPPFTAGADAAGIVEEVGSGVTEFKKGDRVYVVATFTGTYAEYCVAPLRHVVKLDDKLTFSQGASIGIPYHTASKALYNRAQAKPGEIVLIHGASGAVGVAAVQMAKAYGQRVFGTAGTKEGMELVKRQGAEQVFNHREADYTDKIMKATNGKGVDVILEMLANVNLDKDLDLLGFRGRVVIVGCRGDIKLSPGKTMFKETSIMGISLMSLDHDKEWQLIGAGVEAGQRLGWLVPVVGKEYKLEEAGQAQTDIINSTGALGKLVLKVA